MDANYTKAKQILDTLFEAITMSYEIVDHVHDSFIKGRVAKIMVKDQRVGIIGELHPQIVTDFALEMPLAVIELDIAALFRILHAPISAVKSAPAVSKSIPKKK